MIKVKMIPEEGVYCDTCDKEIGYGWDNPVGWGCVVCGKHVCEQHGARIHNPKLYQRGMVCLSHLYPLMDDEGREKWGYGK